MSLGLRTHYYVTERNPYVLPTTLYISTKIVFLSSSMIWLEAHNRVENGSGNPNCMHMDHLGHFCGHMSPKIWMTLIVICSIYMTITIA